MLYLATVIVIPCKAHCASITNLAMATRAVVVWEKGEPVRLARGYAISRASCCRPKPCSDALIDLVAGMEPHPTQKQAKQGSHGAGRQARNGAAGEVRVVVQGSCPFVQAAGSGQFLREDISASAERASQQGAGAEAALPVDGGPEARVQAGDRKSEDERLLDELKALRLQVLGLGAQEEASN